MAQHTYFTTGSATYWGDLGGTLTSISATQVDFTNSDGTITRLFGSGFAENPPGTLVTGTITLIDRFSSTNAFLERIQNISYSAATFSAHLANDGDYSTIFSELFSGNDLIRGNNRNGTQLFGFDGNDNIQDNDSTSTTTNPDDTLNGGAGDDTLSSSGGVDVLDGGADIDVAIVNRSTGTVAETLDFSDPTVMTTLVDGTTLINIERINLAAGSADDSLLGGGLDDTLSGGAGNDTLDGAAGNDSLDGGNDNDSVLGGTGDDTLVVGVGAGIDTLDGGADIDLLQANNAASIVAEILDLSDPTVQQTLVGGSTVINVERMNYSSGNGADSLVGGLYDDTMVTGFGNDTIVGGGGRDSINAGDGDDSLVAGIGDDTLIGGTNNDTILGGGGRDSILAGDGDDTVIAGDAAETGSFYQFDGGSGTDSLTLDRSGQTLNHSINLNTTSFLSDGGRFFNFEQLDFTGGSGNETVRTHSPSTLDDYLRGMGGNDYLEAFGGNNTLEGGDGDDTLVTSIGIDHIDGGADIDQLLVNRGTSTVSETLDLSDPTVSSTLTGGASVINVERTDFTSGSGDDSLLGGALNDRFATNAGNDTIDSGGGRDNISSGDGDDTVIVRDGPQTGVSYTLDGGNDTDLLILDRSGQTVSRFINLSNNSSVGDGGTVRNFEQIDFTGGSGNDQILGHQTSGLADHMRGNGGNDNLSGFGGNDTLEGGADNDTLDGGDGDDSLDGGTGDDRLVLSDGADTLDGGADTDQLLANRATSTVAETIDLTDPTVQQTLVGGATLVNVERTDYTSGTGNDSLVGGAFDDRFVTSGGNDTIDSGGGRDNISSGDGNDTVISRDGSQTGTFYTLDGGNDIDFLMLDRSSQTNNFFVNLSFFAGTGDNGQINNFEQINFTGGSGNDQILAHQTSGLADTMRGNAGNDVLYGYGGNDSLDGGAGNDQLRGGTGNDTLDGGADNDQLFGEADDDVITGGTGFDNLQAGGGRDSLDGGADGDNLNDGDSTATPATPDDTLLGGDGDDQIISGGGVDVIDGGADTDYAGINRSTSTTAETVDITDSSVLHTLSDGTTFVNIERLGLTTGSGNDTLTGGALSDTFDAGGGDDSITAAAGTDLVYGRDGNDWIDLGDDNDYGYGGADNDTIDGGRGSDQLYGEAGDDILVSNDTDNTIDGGDGTDLAIISRTSFLANLTLDVLSSGGDMGDGTQYFRLEQLDFTGGSGNDDVSGGVLDDTLRGGEGRDQLTGRSGNDKLYGDGGLDLLDGGTGNDEMYGGAGFDTLDGGADNDLLDGGTGFDVMIGGTGDDTYYVDAIGDVVFESPAEGTDKVFAAISYTLTDDVENLELTGTAVAGGGNALDNEIRGNAAANDLTGGAGADTLLGLAGDDTLHITFADVAPGEVIDGGDDFDTLAIDGGGSGDLSGFTRTSIEAITLTSAVGTTLTLSSVTDAALITNAAGANDVVKLGTTPGVNTALVKQLIDAGVERVEWSSPGFASDVEAVPDGLGGFIISYDDGDDIQPWDTIDVQYDSLGRQIAQTNDYDFPGPEGGITLNFTYDPVTGFATTIVNTDGHLTRTFSTITTTLENGVVTKVDTINDNNTASNADDTLVEQFFTAGVITLERTNDTSSANAGKPWLYIDREYEGGVTQIFRTFWDAGVNGGGQQVVGAAGSQVIEGVVAGGGVSTTNDALIGGAGADTFRFVDGFGHDTIYDFVDGTDLLDLTGYGSGIDTLAELEAAASITEVAFGAGFNTVIAFNGTSDQITIRNLNVAQLGDGDFAV